MLQIIPGILKNVFTGLVVVVLVLALLLFVIWRAYQRYKRKDMQGAIFIMKEISDVVQSSDNIEKVTVATGQVTMEVKKQEGKKKPKEVADVYPHQWPDVISGKVFKVFIETQEGIVEKSLLAYHVPAKIEDDSVLFGTKLYFMFHYVPDQFKKFKRSRAPIDAFNVEEGQILGYIGECNEFFILMAKIILDIFGVRINVLNNKQEVLSPAKGMIGQRYVEDFEPVSTGEYLFTIYYEIPHSEVKETG